MSCLDHRKEHELLVHLLLGVAEQIVLVTCIFSEIGAGAVCTRNIPSSITDCGVQAPGKFDTITLNFLYRVAKCLEALTPTWCICTGSVKDTVAYVVLKLCLTNLSKINEIMHLFRSSCCAGKRVS